MKMVWILVVYSWYIYHLLLSIYTSVQDDTMCQTHEDSASETSLEDMGKYTNLLNMNLNLKNVY